MVWSTVGEFAIIFCLFLNLAVGLYINNAPLEFPSVYERKISYKDGLEGDNFGDSVSINQNTLLVGSCFNDEQGEQSGSAHIFEIDDSSSGWRFVTTLVANITEYDYYGWSVSLGNTWALVGAWQDDTFSTNAGAVYFYERIEDSTGVIWNNTLKVTGGNDYNYFGIAVAIEPNSTTVLIGAPGSNRRNGLNVSGAAHIYVRSSSSWSESSVLYPSDEDTTIDDYFGSSVAVSDFLAVVGAYGHNPGTGSFSGAAYVYRLQRSSSSWIFEAKLVASDSYAGHYFGRSVTVFDRYAAIGSDGHDGSGTGSGAVYAYYRSGKTWSQTQIIYPPEGSDYSYFGGSISMWNDSLVVGAEGTKSPKSGKNSGSFWYFKRYNDGTSSNALWERVYQVNASDSSLQDMFGRSVSIYGNTIAAGAVLADGYDYDSGAVYVYSDLAMISDSEVHPAMIIIIFSSVVLGSVIVILLLIKLYRLIVSCFCTKKESHYVSYPFTIYFILLIFVYDISYY
jgi:hypothetical protein